MIFVTKPIIKEVFEEIEKNFVEYFDKYFFGGIVATNVTIESFKEKMKINSNIKISIDKSKFQKSSLLLFTSPDCDLTIMEKFNNKTVVAVHISI